MKGFPRPTDIQPIVYGFMSAPFRKDPLFNAQVRKMASQMIKNTLEIPLRKRIKPGDVLIFHIYHYKKQGEIK